MEMRSDRFNSLTGMRVIAMLTIFYSHLYCLHETPFHGFYHLIDNGRLGVNFFLVLSGYVLALGYSNKLNENSISQDFHFIKRRLSKIYVPYIITMILAIPLYILNVTAGENPLNVKLLIVRLLINTGLIQSAIPFARYSVSINEVSWFISTIFIIYLF